MLNQKASPIENFRLRDARGCDINEFEFIEESSHIHPRSMENIYRVWNHRQTYSKVVEHRGIVVGFVLYQMRDKFIRIITLGVHPDYRRKGISTKLIKYVKTFMSSHRNSIVVKIHEDEFATHKLFFKNGFFLHKRVLSARYEDNRADYEFHHFLDPSDK